MECEPIVSTIVNQIRRGIQTGEYRSGEKIREIEICERNNVSRTPVREAFRLLQMEGLLVHNLNKGVQVADFCGDDQLALMEIRARLECLAVYKAAEYVTDEDIAELQEINARLLEFDENDTWKTKKLDECFHMKINQMSKNPYLIDFKKEIIRKTNILDCFVPFKKERIPHTHREHENIIFALKKRDPILAEKYMEIHFHFSVKSLSEKIDNYNRKQIV